MATRHNHSSTLADASDEEMKLADWYHKRLCQSSWLVVSIAVTLSTACLAILGAHDSDIPWGLSATVIVISSCISCWLINADELRNDYPFYRVAVTIVNSMGGIAVATMFIIHVIRPAYNMGEMSGLVTGMVIFGICIALISWSVVTLRNRRR